MSEGAGILILESLSHALHREAKIYAEVIGYAASSDAYHIVATHPEGKGAYLAMRSALKMPIYRLKKLMLLVPMQQVQKWGHL